MYNANAHRVNQGFLINHSPNWQSPASQAYYEHDVDNQQSLQPYGRRYTPISISRSLAAGVIEPSTNYALAEDFPDPPNNKPDRLETDSMDDNPGNYEQPQSVACSMCDCTNNCFCYPVCGCDKLYSMPHTAGEFTLCPLTSESVDASCLCAGIESETEQVETRRNIVFNTICLPFISVADLVTLVPRMFISACSSACYS